MPQVPSDEDNVRLDLIVQDSVHRPERAAGREVREHGERRHCDPVRRAVRQPQAEPERRREEPRIAPVALERGEQLLDLLPRVRGPRDLADPSGRVLVRLRYVREPLGLLPGGA